MYMQLNSSFTRYIVEAIHSACQWRSCLEGWLDLCHIVVALLDLCHIVEGLLDLCHIVEGLLDLCHIVEGWLDLCHIVEGWHDVILQAKKDTGYDIAPYEASRRSTCLIKALKTKIRYHMIYFIFQYIHRGIQGTNQRAETRQEARY